VAFHRARDDYSRRAIPGFEDAQPTLVMTGTDDPIVPIANGRILTKLIPDARMVTIDDGHLFLVTSAKQCAELVSEFLSKQ
jgi:poly(3-hydroxyoctanoate) depolymerase